MPAICLYACLPPSKLTVYILERQRQTIQKPTVLWASQCASSLSSPFLSEKEDGGGWAAVARRLDMAGIPVSEEKALLPFTCLCLCQPLSPISHGRTLTVDGGWEEAGRHGFSARMAGLSQALSVSCTQTIPFRSAKRKFFSGKQTGRQKPLYLYACLCLLSYLISPYISNFLRLSEGR